MYNLYLCVIIILISFISGSSSLLQCSDSWCNDDQTTTVDRVCDHGVYVTYVCRIPDTSIALRWEVSSGEAHIFTPTDLIGATVVFDDDIFFYTPIDNGSSVSLASSLSFNFKADSLNGTVISCTDLSTMTTDNITVVSQGKANMVIIIIIIMCNYIYCQRML